MPRSTLWTRITALWRGEATDEEGESSGSSTTEATGTDDETLSYAEQVEYGVDERELSDEDKVLRLLVKRGGRVNQRTIAEETDWSESRLTTVIDRMEDEDQISAITVGRKRVICRRGFEPKGYRSHLNE